MVGWQRRGRRKAEFLSRRVAVPLAEALRLLDATRADPPGHRPARAWRRRTRRESLFERATGNLECWLRRTGFPPDGVLAAVREVKKLLALAVAGGPDPHELRRCDQKLEALVGALACGRLPDWLVPLLTAPPPRPRPAPPRRQRPARAPFCFDRAEYRRWAAALDFCPRLQDHQSCGERHLATDDVRVAMARGMARRAWWDSFWKVVTLSLLVGVVVVAALTVPFWPAVAWSDGQSGEAVAFFSVGLAAAALVIAGQFPTWVRVGAGFEASGRRYGWEGDLTFLLVWALLVAGSLIWGLALASGDAGFDVTPDKLGATLLTALQQPPQPVPGFIWPWQVWAFCLVMLGGVALGLCVVLTGQWVLAQAIRRHRARRDVASGVARPLVRAVSLLQSEGRGPATLATRRQVIDMVDGAAANLDAIVARLEMTGEEEKKKLQRHGRAVVVKMQQWTYRVAFPRGEQDATKLVKDIRVFLEPVVHGWLGSLADFPETGAKLDPPPTTFAVLRSLAGALWPLAFVAAVQQWGPASLDTELKPVWIFSVVWALLASLVVVDRGLESRMPLMKEVVELLSKVVGIFKSDKKDGKDPKEPPAGDTPDASDAPGGDA